MYACSSLKARHFGDRRLNSYIEMVAGSKLKDHIVFAALKSDGLLLRSAAIMQYSSRK
jgi:hypothetical protein